MSDPNQDVPEDPESYHGYSVDDEDQPQGAGDSLADDRGLEEPLDEGYSPPEKWSAAQGYGNTPLEEVRGESLDQRVAQEVPEPDPYAEAEREAADPDKDQVADDVGVDGAAAGAEEAAVHVVPDEPA